MKRNLDNIKKLLEARVLFEAKTEHNYKLLHKSDLQEAHKRIRWEIEDILRDISTAEDFNKACKTYHVEEDK